MPGKLSCKAILDRRTGDTEPSCPLCNQSLYSKYERGERDLPLEYADKLADYYGVSVDYLLCRTNCKQPYPRK
ncbi:MAG: helix-turn-helix transcriptional regulator [Ruminococcaceae bacterium]|nr:helix-turn-helix transcriptional regulator [Oscillospiraceae bacterium]